MGYYLLDHPNRSGPNFYTTRRMPVLAIVVHITAGLQDLDLVGPDHSAEGVCRYAATTDRDVSWHRSSDTDSEIELLPTSYTAWHCANYNSTTIGHEISKLDVSWHDKPAEWVTRTLRMAAVGPAGTTGLRRLAQLYRVPARRGTRAELDAAIAHYRRTGEIRPVGFLAHSDLDPDRRRDPGWDFPWPRFLSLIATGPAPRPAPPQEDDMPLTPADGQTVLNTRVEIPTLLRPAFEQTSYTAEQMLLGANYWSAQAAKNLAAFTAQSAGRDAALLAAIKSLAAGDDVDLAAIQAAARAGAAEALADFEFPADPIPPVTR